MHTKYYVLHMDIHSIHLGYIYIIVIYYRDMYSVLENMCHYSFFIRALSIQTYLCRLLCLFVAFSCFGLWHKQINMYKMLKKPRMG